jgi:hypothetical protein
MAGSYHACESPAVVVPWRLLVGRQTAVLPQTFGGGASPETVASAVASLVHQEAIEMQLTDAEHPGWLRAVVSRGDYGNVLNQMVALGLVEARNDPTDILATRWFATPYGLQTGSRLLAIKHTKPRW